MVKYLIIDEICIMNAYQVDYVMEFYESVKVGKKRTFTEIEQIPVVINSNS